MRVVNLPNALNFKMYRMKKPEFLPTLFLQFAAFDDERFRIYAIAVDRF